jgi:hypothetical protein
VDMRMGSSSKIHRSVQSCHSYKAQDVDTKLRVTDRGYLVTEQQRLLSMRASQRWGSLGIL